MRKAKPKSSMDQKQLKADGWRQRICWGSNMYGNFVSKTNIQHIKLDVPKISEPGTTPLHPTDPFNSQDGSVALKSISFIISR